MKILKLVRRPPASLYGQQSQRLEPAWQQDSLHLKRPLSEVEDDTASTRDTSSPLPAGKRRARRFGALARGGPSSRDESLSGSGDDLASDSDDFVELSSAEGALSESDDCDGSSGTFQRQRQRVLVVSRLTPAEVSRGCASCGHGNSLGRQSKSCGTIQRCDKALRGLFVPWGSRGDVEYLDFPVAALPPDKDVELFYGLMSSRELVARNRACGLSGAQQYAGLPERFASYFRRRVCPNVKRREDRTSRGLHEFCAAHARLAICRTEAERHQFLRLLVLNFAMWRTIGGTVAFATEIGFLASWGEKEKGNVRDVVSRAFREKRIAEVLSDAYESPGKIRRALMHLNANEETLEAVLFNTGPQAFQDREPVVSYKTFVGKFRWLDKIWELASNVVAAAEADPTSGLTRSRPVAEVLARVPFFGTTEEGVRMPTFFTKELIQDLLDTPVFPGGRAKCADLRSYVSAGPGALDGLRRLYSLQAKPLQREAIPMMRALLAAASGPGGWIGDAGELELHDVQFVLCEYQKFLRDQCLRDYAGPPIRSVPLATRDYWRERVEEALVLRRESGKDDLYLQDRQALNSTAAGSRCDSRLVPEVVGAVSEWLSLPAPELRGDRPALHSGDHIVLHADSEHVLAVGPESQGSRLQCSRWTTRGTVFLVERCAGAGPLALGEDVFLRAPNGPHLGPEPSRALSALKSSARYGEGRRLWFTGSGRHVLRSGDHVRIASHAARGGWNFLEAGQDFCRMVPRAQVRKGSPSIFRVELHNGRPGSRQLTDHLSQAVLDGLTTGSLQKSSDGRLLVTCREDVRRRLVGASAEGRGVAAAGADDAYLLRTYANKFDMADDSQDADGGTHPRWQQLNSAPFDESRPIIVSDLF